MAKVKICGNTNSADIQKGIEFGADFLGLIFVAGSKRFVDPEHARSLIESAPGFENFVGVFFNQPKEEVEAIIETTGIKRLQFHGDETSRYCGYFMQKGYSVIKTFRIQDARSMLRMDEYDVTSYLFDTFSKTSKGGTGETFDWSLIQDKPYVHEKLFLAGGLNLENLKQALQTVHPFAVDVASGVESAPGKKDHAKLRQFIQIAHGVSSHVPT